MRDAILSEYRLIRAASKSEHGLDKYEKVEVGVVKFHEFGLSYDNCEHGVGQFSSAIIEMPDGQLENVPVELLQFVKEDILLN